MYTPTKIAKRENTRTAADDIVNIRLARMLTNFKWGRMKKTSSPKTTELNNVIQKCAKVQGLRDLSTGE